MAPNKSLHLLTGSLSVKCVLSTTSKGVMFSLSVPLKPLCKKTKKSHNINCSQFSMDCHCHTTEAHPGQCPGLKNYFILPFWTIHTWLKCCLSPSHRSRSSVMNSRGFTSTLLLPSPWAWTAPGMWLSLDNHICLTFQRKEEVSGTLPGVHAEPDSHILNLTEQIHAKNPNSGGSETAGS